MVQHILRKPAIGGHASGAMSLVRVAIIETRGVLADETVVTPTAPVMRFNTDPVAHGEFIHGLTQGHDGPSPLVSRRKGAKRQGQREVPVVDLEVGATGPTHGHLYQHLARARLRYREEKEIFRKMLGKC